MPLSIQVQAGITMDWENEIDDNAIEPQVNDVLFGNGTGARNHLGTLRFYELIQSNARRYASVELRYMKDIVVDIMLSIQNSGRFIALTESEWHVIPDEIVINKIERAIRYFNSRSNNEREVPQVSRKRTTESNDESVKAKKSVHSDRNRTYLPVTTKKPLFGGNSSQNGYESTSNERGDKNLLFRKILQDAKIEVELTESEMSNAAEDLRHGISKDMTLYDEYSNAAKFGSDDDHEMSGLLNTAESRRLYMDYLRNVNSDVDVDRKRPPDNSCDRRLGANQCLPSEIILGVHGNTYEQVYELEPTFDKVSQNNALCVSLDNISASAWLSGSMSTKSCEALESDFASVHPLRQPENTSNLECDGIDYLTRPIDVDESINNFLNAVEDDSLKVNDNDNYKYISKYKRQISEFIDEAVSELEAAEDKKCAPSTLTTVTPMTDQEGNDGCFMNNTNGDNEKMMSCVAVNSPTEFRLEHDNSVTFCTSNSCRKDIIQQQETNTVSPWTPKCLSR